MVNLWKVNLSPEAKKRLQKIPNPDRRRILTALDALYTGPSGDDSSSIYRFQGRRVQMMPPLPKRCGHGRRMVAMLTVLEPDITTLQVVAIVNAANNSLPGCGGWRICLETLS